MTPHNVHVEGHFAVVDARRSPVPWRSGACRSVLLERPVDREFVAALAGAAAGLRFSRLLRRQRPERAAAPMDWGSSSRSPFVPETPGRRSSAPRGTGPSQSTPSSGAQSRLRPPPPATRRARRERGPRARPRPGRAVRLRSRRAEYDDAIVELVLANRLDRLHELEPLWTRRRPTASGRWSSCTARSRTPTRRAALVRGADLLRDALRRVCAVRLSCLSVFVGVQRARSRSPSASWPS